MNNTMDKFTIPIKSFENLSRKMRFGPQNTIHKRLRENLMLSADEVEKLVRKSISNNVST